MNKNISERILNITNALNDLYDLINENENLFNDKDVIKDCKLNISLDESIIEITTILDNVIDNL